MCSCLLIEVLLVFKNGKFQSNIRNGFGTKYLKINMGHLLFTTSLHFKFEGHYAHLSAML